MSWGHYSTAKSAIIRGRQSCRKSLITFSSQKKILWSIVQIVRLDCQQVFVSANKNTKVNHSARRSWLSTVKVPNLPRFQQNFSKLILLFPRSWFFILLCRAMRDKWKISSCSRMQFHKNYFFSSFSNYYNFFYRFIKKHLFFRSHDTSQLKKSSRIHQMG